MRSDNKAPYRTLVRHPIDRRSQGWDASSQVHDQAWLRFRQSGLRLLLHQLTGGRSEGLHLEMYQVHHQSTDGVLWQDREVPEPLRVGGRVASRYKPIFLPEEWPVQLPHAPLG